MGKYNEKEILHCLEILSNWQPSLEAADRAIERVRKTLTDAQTRQAASNKKGRRTVTRIIEFAAAAAVIIAVIIGINQFGVTPAKASVSWAEVAKQLEQIEMFICRGQRGSAEAVKEGTAETHWIEYYSSRHGIRWDFYHKDKKVRTKYLLSPENMIVEVFHPQRTYGHGTLSDGQVRRRLDYYDPKKMIDELLSSEYTQLPRKTINGIEVEGIEGVLEFEAQTNRVICFWVDVKTQLPVLIEWKRIMPDGTKVRKETAIDQFQWDVELGPSIFEPNIPTDYTLTHEVNLADNEATAVEGLHGFADLADGQYPSSLAFESAMKEIEEVWHRNKIESSKENRERYFGIQAACLFYSKLVRESKDAAYYGKTVTAKDNDKILMRWRISNGQYRVIFGDLKAENVSAEKLAELEKFLSQ